MIEPLATLLSHATVHPRAGLTDGLDGELDDHLDSAADARQARGALRLSARMERVRRDFAERVEKLAALQTPGLADAFARVPREAFVGPGPWLLLRPPDEQGYVETPDDDPSHLYDHVLVALDASRGLNNGEPVSLAQWLDQLGLAPGNSLAYIGCGVGYYTAIASETLLPGGRCLALEAVPELADRAAHNLAHYAGVEVRNATALLPEDGLFEAVFVNAGATGVLPAWLDALAQGGHLLVPLTVSVGSGEIGAGRVLLVVRRGARFEARFVSFAAIFHCVGARSEEGDAALRSAYAEGDADAVRSLRRSDHSLSPDCWLHTPGFCLSYLEESP